MEYTDPVKFSLAISSPVETHDHTMMMTDVFKPFFAAPRTEPSARWLYFICSPWLSPQSIARLDESMEGMNRNHCLLLLTARHHETAHWRALIAKLRKLKNFSFVQVRVLPNHRGQNIKINDDALHVKAYWVGKVPNAGSIDLFTSDTSRDITAANLAYIAAVDVAEAFIGSMNFTVSGMGRTPSPSAYEADRKWELLARACDDEARQAVANLVFPLWSKADRLYPWRKKKYS